MKNFIQKNKWLITTVLIILMQVQEIVELSPAVRSLIQIAIIALTVFTQRAELIEKVEAKNNLHAKGLIGFKVTIHQMLWDLIKQIPTDFQRKNITKKENIPSHILIGWGVLFVTSGLLNIGWTPLLFYTFGGFFAFVAGFLTEGVQAEWFGGTPNNRDVRWTVYGYYIGIPSFIILNRISDDYLSNLITGVVLWILAFVLHKLNR
jgi:hypothetical protein